MTMRIRKTAEVRRQEIIETTLRLADEVGPDRLTTEMIAREVGLSQPGIFRHFPKKENIWEAVALVLSERMGKVWEDATDAPDTPPLERLRNLVRRHLQLIESTPALPAILFSREMHLENEALRRTFFGTMQKFHAHLVELLEEAKKRGDVRPDLPSEDAAYLVIAIIQSLALRWSLSGRAMDLVKTGERLLEVQFQGFACQGTNGGSEK